MAVTTSQKMHEIVRVGVAASGAPNATLAAVVVAVKALIPEVEALEKGVAPVEDATPSFMDDLRVRSDALKAQIEAAGAEFRKTLADGLRAAAKNLDRGTDAAP